MKYKLLILKLHLKILKIRSFLEIKVDKERNINLFSIK